MDDLKHPSDPVDGPATNPDFPKRMLIALCAGVFLAIPFLHSDALLDPSLLPGWIGVSALIVGLQSALLPGRKPGIRVPDRLPLILAAFGGYCLVALVSGVVAVNPVEAILEWFKSALTFHLMLLSFVLMHAAGPVSTRGALSRSLSVFGIAASGLGLWQYSRLGISGGGDLERLYDIRGTFGHKNLLSSLLFLSLPFSAFSALADKGKWRLAGLAGLSSSLALIFLLQTRSVWLACVVSLLGAGLLVLVAFRPRRGAPSPEAASGGPARRRMRRRGGVLGLVLAGTMVAGLWLAFPDAVKDRWASIFDREKNGWRILIWEKSLSMASDRPWLGVGPGNWKLHILHFGLKDLRVVGGVRAEREQYGLHPQNPHNDFLWVLCETGGAGILLYAAFFLGLMAACAVHSLRHPDRVSRIYAICLFAAVSGYAVDACFSFPRERILHSAFLAVLAASIAALPPVPGARQAWRWRWHLPGTRPAKVAAILLPGLILLVGCLRFRSEMHMRVALEARENEHWDTVIAAIDRVETRTYPLDPFTNPVVFYRGTAHFIRGDIARARADFEEAHRVNPYHVHVLNNLGACLAREGKNSLALEHFRKAHALEPDFEEVILNIATIHFGMKGYRRAEAWLNLVAPGSRSPRWQAMMTAIEEAGRGGDNDSFQGP